jgi:exonuclease VII large subunit
VAAELIAPNAYETIRAVAKNLRTCLNTRLGTVLLTKRELQSKIWRISGLYGKVVYKKGQVLLGKLKATETALRKRIFITQPLVNRLKFAPAHIEGKMSLINETLRQGREAIDVCPISMLKKGYVRLVSDNGATAKKVSELNRGDSLTATLIDGEISLCVTAVNSAEKKE